MNNFASENNITKWNRIIYLKTVGDLHFIKYRTHLLGPRWNRIRKTPKNITNIVQRATGGAASQKMFSVKEAI